MTNDDYYRMEQDAPEPVWLFGPHLAAPFVLEVLPPLATPPLPVIPFSAEMKSAWLKQAISARRAALRAAMNPENWPAPIY